MALGTPDLCSGQDKIHGFFHVSTTAAQVSARVAQDLEVVGSLHKVIANGVYFINVTVHHHLFRETRKMKMLQL